MVGHVHDKFRHVFRLIITVRFSRVSYVRRTELVIIMQPRDKAYRD